MAILFVYTELTRIKLKNLAKIFRLLHGLTALIREETLFTEKFLKTAPIQIKILKKLLIFRIGRSNDLSQTLQKLGPTWIKLGQFLSTRPDIIGQDLSEKLKNLQDQLPPFDKKETLRILHEEFGENFEEIFINIESAKSAASIAQVHKSTIKVNDNESEVALKILRPNIKKNIKRDLEDFFFAAKFLERFSVEAKRLRLTKIIETLEEIVGIETDLRLEAASQSEVRENTINDEFFYVPKINWDLTRKNILVSEWVGATSANNIPEIKGMGLNLKEIGKKIIEVFLTLSIRDGLFHADMHQGNLFIDNKGKIIAVDFGIMGRLNNESKRYLLEILLGFINRDYERIADIHFDANYVPAEQNKDKFAQALRAIGEPIQGKEASEISIGRLLSQLFEVTNQFNMRTQPQLILLQKTMVVVEGVAREFNSEINIWSHSEPILKNLQNAKFDILSDINNEPDKILRKARNFIENLPKDFEKAKKNLTDLGEIFDRDGIKIHPESIDKYNQKKEIPLISGIIIIILVFFLLLLIFKG